MRAIVHDYSGHPFQVQLSRALARRGHQVLHVHCSSYETGKGAVASQPEDPPTFAVEAIDMGRRFDRYSIVSRFRQELYYGGAFASRARAYGPDVILSSNDPLFAKAVAARWCEQSATPWVYWLQDIYSLAMTNIARSRFGVAGTGLGRGFQRLERRLLGEAAGVVAITADFLPMLRDWSVPEERVHVIENWAPLEELPAVPRDNRWSRDRELAGPPVLLYAGTLGLKHDPRVLVRMAERFQSTGAKVVVVSEGAGATWLAKERDRLGLDNLVLLPYQPFEQLPEVLASADVLVALLDPAAGVFSVPSKILTYLCAGRPILAALPGSNLGARTIERSGGGVVVAPDDPEAMVQVAEQLLGDEARRARMGGAARAYAERTFDIERITDRFERILSEAVTSTAR